MMKTESSTSPTTSTRPTSDHRRHGASIVIAAAGPEDGDRFQTRFGDVRSRNGALLQHTRRDAEAVYSLWTKQTDRADDLDRLLFDPTLGEVESTIRQVSSQLCNTYSNDIGLDLFFAGHGEPDTGYLVLKDGLLSPDRFLDLQAEDVRSVNANRLLRVWMDSCYSGAFLLRLAIAAFDDDRFTLDDGLASSLPDEESLEMDLLGHGIFTYTRLYPGNAHVDTTRFNQAILRDDVEEIAKNLQGLVGMMGSATAFLTEGKQFPVELLKHRLWVQGDYAEVELGESNDFSELAEQLTAFKKWHKS